jgi:hypothetical protein
MADNDCWEKGSDGRSRCKHCWGFETYGHTRKCHLHPENVEREAQQARIDALGEALRECSQILADWEEGEARYDGWTPGGKEAYDKARAALKAAGMEE